MSINFALALSLLNMSTMRAGRVVRFDGAIAGAVGCSAPVGAACEIDTTDGLGGHGEVIGFREQETMIALTNGSARIAAGALVQY